MRPEREGPSPEPTLAPQALPQEDGSRPDRVLLVDDDQAVRRVVTRMLRLLGYDVESAASGDEGVEMLRADPSYEAAIIDLVMPGAHGPQTLAGMRAIVPTLGCVLISGFEVESLEYELPEDEHTTFLGKPFRKEALVAKLREVLAQARSRRSG